MPIYKNITSHSVSITEGGIPPSGTVILDGYIYSDYFEKISDTPLPSGTLEKKLYEQANTPCPTQPPPLIMDSRGRGGSLGLTAIKNFGYIESLSLTGGTLWDKGRL